MRVAVIGSGYVGSVTATCLASIGHEVACVDVDEDRIAAFGRGQIPFYEPGLEELISASGNRLTFGSDLHRAVENAQIVFVAVGTPPCADGQPDLRQIFEATEGIADSAAAGAVLVIKSTVPVGTGAEVERRLRERRGQVHLSVASNPEFLREGSAISDFLHPDRIVIGVEDAKAETALRKLYRPLIAARVPLLVTGRIEAELSKYAANGMLAMKIAFINEIADLCERVGADVGEVSHAVGMDSRIGSAFLQAGPGYGGSCFPKDTRALAHLGRSNGSALTLIEAAIESNRSRVETLIDRVVQSAGSLTGRQVAVLGLAFKPNTDDVRESPALALLAGLRKHGAMVHACDPKAGETAKRVIPDLVFFEDPYEACKRADVTIIVTDWELFRSLDLRRLRDAMGGDLLVDFRNQYDPAEAAANGLRYISIGRRKGSAASADPVVLSRAALRPPWYDGHERISAEVHAASAKTRSLS